MAKIGTAHIELKPVLDETSLEVIAKRIEDAVAEGVRRGLGAGNGTSPVVNVVASPSASDVAERQLRRLARIRDRNNVSSI